jgi:hypothetical protein
VGLVGLVAHDQDDRAGAEAARLDRDLRVRDHAAELDRHRRARVVLEVVVVTAAAQNEHGE